MCSSVMVPADIIPHCRRDIPSLRLEEDVSGEDVYCLSTSETSLATRDKHELSPTGMLGNDRYEIAAETFLA